MSLEAPMSDAKMSQHMPATERLRAPRVDRLLVATDASNEHTSSLVAARWISETTHAAVQVLSAVPLVLELGSAYGVVPLAPAAHQPHRDAAWSAIKSKVAKVAGAENAWPVAVEFGEATEVIARAASTYNAQLIVAERSHRSGAARLLGRDLVLRLLQVGDTPVLSVAPGQESLPKRVVIATDLSAMSDYAAQVALPIIAPDATIFLVNVQQPADVFDSAWEVESSIADTDARAAALQRATQAVTRTGTTIESVSLTGDPAEEILQFAASRNADLIVTATHGYGFFRRLVLGSVATELLRSATCSVLCVPGSAEARVATRAITPHAHTTRSYDAVEWPATLDQFSKRNSGRRCTIEIDHGNLGAQVQGTNVPFVGAVYEPHNNTAELIFGETTIVGRHFTSMITNVSDISIATDENGNDQSLRIANTQGQTLLLLSRAASTANDLPPV